MNILYKYSKILDKRVYFFDEKWGWPVSVITLYQGNISHF